MQCIVVLWLLLLLLTSLKTNSGAAPNPYNNVYVALIFCTSCLPAHFPIFVTLCIAIFLVFVPARVSLGSLSWLGCPSPPLLWDHTEPPPCPPRVSSPRVLGLLGLPLWVVCAVLLAGSTPTHRLSAVRLWVLLCFARSGSRVGRPSVGQGQ